MSAHSTTIHIPLALVLRASQLERHPSAHSNRCYLAFGCEHSPSSCQRQSDADQVDARGRIWYQQTSRRQAHHTN
ncbi:hypothetical protein FA95DRAFT_211131 [Auriscalpium vulgare]|uniref:Uncharacterized protein n=1 Tax=Auriscalpium vulgare TaxID=40419 RepID=A0ACB8RMB8_9AGAM|nr:hypothetical protein FA95DRAFT_211131 [Auriscalpium vulgare]